VSYTRIKTLIIDIPPKRLPSFLAFAGLSFNARLTTNTQVKSLIILLLIQYVKELYSFTAFRQDEKADVMIMNQQAFSQHH